MDENEMYVSLELILQLNDGREITYLRDARPEYMGYFSIRESELRNIKTITDLIGMLNQGVSIKNRPKELITVTVL